MEKVRSNHLKYKAKKDYRKETGSRYSHIQWLRLKELSEAPKKEAPEAETAVAETKSSASMKKDELIAFAKENNIEVDEKATKAVIIETIEAALK